MRRAITLTCTTAALVVGGASAATAAPPVREAIPLDCDNGQTFAVEVNGNGEFTPGRIVGSTGVLIPTSFGPFTFTVDTPEDPPETQVDPFISVKGSGNAGQQRPRVNCTFTETETLTEPTEIEPGTVVPAGTVLTFSGTVTGFLTGPR